METEKTIKLNLESSGLNSGLTEARGELNSLSKETLEGIRDRTSSQKEFNEELRKEIEYRRTINQVSNKEARQEYNVGMFNARDEADREDTRNQLDDAINQSKLDEVQNLLLEKILYAIEHGKGGSVAGPEFFDKYNEREGSGVLSGMSEEEKRNYFKGNKFGMFALSSVRSVTGASTATDMGLGLASTAGSGMLALGGGAAAAGIGILMAAEIAKAGWSLATEYDKRRGEAYSLTGSDIVENTGLGENYSNLRGLGFSKIDQITAVTDLIKSRLSSEGAYESAVGMLSLKKGINLDQGLYGQMDRLSLLSGDQSGYQNIQSGLAAMRSSGIIKGEDMASVPDYLSIMVQLNKDMAAKLGRVDIGMNTKVVTSLASMDDFLSRSPEALNNMINGIQGGLTGTSSPQMEALQYSVLSRRHPGVSFLELRKMKEAGLATPGYAEDMLERLGDITGGGENLALTLEPAFNLSASTADMVSKGKDKFSKGMREDWRGKQGLSDTDLAKRAASATYSAEIQKAGFQDAGLVVTNGARAAGAALMEFAANMGKLLDWASGTRYGPDGKPKPPQK